MNLKTSKRRRKFANAVARDYGERWPARERRYPGTFSPQFTGMRCPRVVTTRRRRRRGWRGLIDLLLFRRPIVQPVLCGGPVVLVPKSANRRSHFACLHCGPFRGKRRRAG